MMKHKIWIILMMATGMLASCSEDSPTEQGDEQVTNAPLRMMRATRAVSGGYDQFGDIRVLLTNNGTTVSGLFKHEDNDDWTTQLKLKSGARTYRLYGYMPDDATLTCSLNSVTADNAVLRLQGLQPLTTKDYCIVTGVRQVANATDMTAATRGTFSFDYDSKRENYINLLLDHMMSGIGFNMKIGTEYSTVRTIKIKRMTLNVPGISSISTDITLTNGVGISNIAYSVTGTANTSSVIKDEEQTLTTMPVNVCSAYLIPLSSLITNLTLVTEYDVYDKKGNKIAERTATNQLKDALNELQRGENRTLTITVDPSYLYILSDADLDNPPFIIE